ncbi:MAG: serine/threonine-protein kinase [Carbonactinosporaceae bacterium]
MMDRPIGSRYLLGEPLGRGGSGTVYRGQVRETGEAVAIKVLREDLASDPVVVARFLRERSVLMRVRDPHLVGIHDLVVEGEVLALVMDLVQGPDLSAYLHERGPLPAAEAAAITAGVVDALQAVHAAGVVHRDLKPANVLLDRADGRLRPRLSDFGIARLADGAGVTRTNEFLGTPSYIAPEMARGQTPTSAADIYSTGILLYELTTGTVPFPADSPFEVIRRHLDDEPKRPPGLPDALWAVIADCLQKQPEQRPDARRLRRGLDRSIEVLGGMPAHVMAAAPGAAGESSSTQPAHPAVGAAGAAAAAGPPVPVAGGSGGPPRSPTPDDEGTEVFSPTAQPHSGRGDSLPTMRDRTLAETPPHPRPAPAMPVWRETRVVRERVPASRVRHPAGPPVERPVYYAPPGPAPRRRRGVLGRLGRSCLMSLVSMLVIALVIAYLVQAALNSTWFQDVQSGVSQVQEWFSTVSRWLDSVS